MCQLLAFHPIGCIFDCTVDEPIGAVNIWRDWVLHKLSLSFSIWSTNDAILLDTSADYWQHELKLTNPIEIGKFIDTVFQRLIESNPHKPNFQPKINCNHSQTCNILMRDHFDFTMCALQPNRLKLQSLWNGTQLQWIEALHSMQAVWLRTFNLNYELLAFWAKTLKACDNNLLALMMMQYCLNANKNWSDFQIAIFKYSNRLNCSISIQYVGEQLFFFRKRRKYVIPWFRVYLWFFIIFHV